MSDTAAKRARYTPFVTALVTFLAGVTISCRLLIPRVRPDLVDSHACYLTAGKSPVRQTFDAPVDRANTERFLEQGAPFKRILI